MRISKTLLVSFMAKLQRRKTGGTLNRLAVTQHFGGKSKGSQMRPDFGVISDRGARTLLYGLRRKSDRNHFNKFLESRGFKLNKTGWVQQRNGQPITREQAAQFEKLFRNMQPLKYRAKDVKNPKFAIKRAKKRGGR